MAFIEKLIGPDEKLIGITRLHWIYGIKGLSWLAGFMVLGGAINWALLSLFSGAAARTLLGGILTLGNAIFWICLLIGLSLFVFYFIMLLATEIGLTTTRLIYKKGLIFVKSEGIDLEEIKGAHVDNEVLGRILNYGTIRFDARFINDLILPAVSDPYRFVKALNDRRSQMKDDSMRIVLEEKGPNVAAALEKTINGALHPEQKEPPPPPLEARRYETIKPAAPLDMLQEISAEARETMKAVENQGGAQAALKELHGIAPDAVPKPKSKPKSKPQPESKEDAAAQQSQPDRASGDKPEPPPAAQSGGPIFIAELSEEMRAEFESSTRH